MQREIIAVMVQETGKFISQLLTLRTRKVKITSSQEPPRTTVYQLPETVVAEERPEDKVKKGVACLPCTNSHLLTCVGLLNEAYRMSPENITPESIERVDKCLAEIAAAERVDLAPENIAKLSDGEKEIAHYALKEMREVRHGLEGLETKEQLENLAARAAETQAHVSKEWFRIRLVKMSKEGKIKVAEKALERFQEGK